MKSFITKEIDFSKLLTVCACVYVRACKESGRGRERERKREQELFSKEFDHNSCDLK